MIARSNVFNPTHSSGINGKLSNRKKKNIMDDIIFLSDIYNTIAIIRSNIKRANNMIIIDYKVRRRFYYLRNNDLYLLL